MTILGGIVGWKHYKVAQESHVDPGNTEGRREGKPRPRQPLGKTLYPVMSSEWHQHLYLVLASYVPPLLLQAVKTTRSICTINRSLSQC